MENLLAKYKGGFSYGEQYETVELILNEESSNNQQLYFEAYNANLYPLPEFETWTQQGKDRLVNAVNEKIPENIKILIDGIVIRNAKSIK